MNYYNKLVKKIIKIPIIIKKVLRNIKKMLTYLKSCLYNTHIGVIINITRGGIVMPKIKALFKDILMKIHCLKSFCYNFKISKKMYRTSAVLYANMILIAVICFSSSNFSAAGKNKLGCLGSDGIFNDEGKIDTDLDDPYLIVEAGENTNDFEAVDSEIYSNEHEDYDALSFVAEALKERVEQNNNIKLLCTDFFNNVNAQIEEYERVKAEEEAKRLKYENIKNVLGINVFTEEDYNNLLRIVEAEVGDNDEYGRVIVANVIINRVRSSEFENTVTGVIFQKRQFSPISNGSFYRVNVSQKTVNAVERALSGEDNSQGALYFMDRSASYKRNVRWFDSNLHYLFSYGGHEYFR